MTGQLVKPRQENIIRTLNNSVVKIIFISKIMDLYPFNQNGYDTICDDHPFDTKTHPNRRHQYTNQNIVTLRNLYLIKLILFFRGHRIQIRFPGWSFELRTTIISTHIRFFVSVGSLATEKSNRNIKGILKSRYPKKNHPVCVCPLVLKVPHTLEKIMLMSHLEF